VTVSVPTGTPGSFEYTLSSVQDANSCSQLQNGTATVTVHPSITLAPVTVSPNSTICNGGSVTLTTTQPTGGTGTFEYQWQSSPNGVDSWTDIPGETALTYTSGSLTTTIYYRLEILSNPCGPVYSGIIMITVQPIILPGAIAGNRTICYNTQPDNLTSSSSGVTPGACGGPPTYRWENSIDNGVSWSLIAGATTPTYNFTGPLTQTTLYRRFTVYSCNGSICTSLPTNTITITVQGTVDPGVIGSDQTICAGTAPSAFTTPPATGSGTIAYQWQQSTTGPAAGFTDIAGATGQNYTPGVLNVDTWFRRNVTSTLSGNACNASSNVIAITVNNLLAGTIAASQTLCSGESAVPFTSTLDASGDGIITYQWQSSITSAAAGFTDIAGATTNIYAPATPSQTTWYRRIATSTLNGIICSVNSNTLEITIVSFTPGTISPEYTEACGSVDPLITGTTVTVLPPSTLRGYQWQVSTDNVTFSDIVGATSQNYDPAPITATRYYRRRVDILTNGKICSDFSNVSAWIIYQVPTINVTATTEVCEGGIITITATATNTTGTPTFTLTHLSGSYIIAPITNITGVFILDPTGLNPFPVGAQVYEVKVSNGNPLACPASTQITVNINDVPEITLTPSCASGGNDGTIQMTGIVTFPAGAFVEYRIRRNPAGAWSAWTTNPLFTNLSIGNYTVEARNSIHPECVTSLTADIQSKTVETFDYSICQGLTVPPGEGLYAGSLCLTWASGNSATKKMCTDDAGSGVYNRSNSVNPPYVAGPQVRYISYMVFQAPDGQITFKDCPGIEPGATYSIYRDPFIPSNPDFNFLWWSGLPFSSCNGGPGITITGLNPNHIYVLVLNSANATTNACTNISITTGDHVQVASGYGPVRWYLTQTSTTPLYTGSTFNPVGHSGSGVPNTNCPGVYTFWAGCDINCREPAYFTVNPHPTAVAQNKNICSGTSTNVPLSATQTCNGVITPLPPNMPVTYSWTSTVEDGSVTGNTNCTDCGPLITDILTSTNNAVCPIVRYDITAKSGDCNGPTISIWVTVINENSITLPTPPANITYTCLTQVPAPGTLTAQHACLGELTATGVDANNGGTGCPSSPLIITRTWTFTDACVNETVTQTITVIDNVPPAFDAPADITINADANCIYLDNPIYTGEPTNISDNCTTSNLNPTYSDVITDQDCINQVYRIISRTWTLVDACGNVTSKVQTISVRDNLAPTFTAPADITIFADASCGYDASTTLTGTVTELADNCTQKDDLTVAYTDAVDATNPCIIIITRTWTVTDLCGNIASEEQLIEVHDKLPPVISCPTGSPFIVVIDDVLNQTYTHTGIDWDASATDNCTGVTFTYTLSGATTTGPISSSTLNGVVFNKGTTTVRWTATDACGNSSFCQFQVLVVEITLTKDCPPTITPGQTITYTITINNNSSSTIPQVELTDVLSPLISDATYTINGSAALPWADSYTWIDMVTGEYIVRINGKLSCDAIDPIFNEASIVYGTSSTNQGTASASCETIVTNFLTLSALPPTSTTCPGAYDGEIDITVTGGTLIPAPSPPHYSFLWTASNGGEIPSGHENDEDQTNLPAGTYTVVVTDANGCWVTQTFIVTPGADTEAPTFDTKAPFEFCVYNIFSAVYDGQPEPDADIQPDPLFSPPYPSNWTRPDWYVVNNKNIASFELDVTNIADNCCTEAQLLNNLTWEITFDVNLVPPRAPISGTGQPSTFDPGNDGQIDEIILWGIPYQNAVHSITYTMTDCNDTTLVTIKTESIVITPRPEVIKQ
jgi:uncharacterized repeat protein (TIGR01451 family)